LIENCKDTNFAQEKLLIFTKLKLKIFQEKRKAILDPISGDPLFFVKFNNKNPSLIIQEFLSLQFKDLENSYNIKIKNPLQVAYAYNAYTLGYIEYCLNNNIDNECDDKLAKMILDTFLHGMLIEELLSLGYQINSISGSSMGALIGGLYACGKMEEYKQWVTPLSKFDILKLLDISFNSSGFIKGEKIFQGINKIIGKVNIEDLPEI